MKTKAAQLILVPLQHIAHSALVKKDILTSLDTPKFAARMLLLTSITKDIFSYTCRIKNAKKNKEIPEDKKSFVIQMDRATRIVTAAVQLCTGLLISSSKLQNAITSKLFKNITDNPQIINFAKNNFASFSTLIFSTLFAKRIIVPLLSTPLAGYLIKKTSKNEEELKKGQEYINKKLYSDSLTEMPFAFKSRKK